MIALPLRNPGLTGLQSEINTTHHTRLQTTRAGSLVLVVNLVNQGTEGLRHFRSVAERVIQLVQRRR